MFPCGSDGALTIHTKLISIAYLAVHACWRKQTLCTTNLFPSWEEDIKKVGLHMNMPTTKAYSQLCNLLYFSTECLWKVTIRNE